MESRSELELLVLGIVWKQGPLTAHAVRMEFTHSKSSHWSGSAGAIYPLVRRLEQAGLIAGADERRGRQDRRVLRITPAGRSALRAWLRPPFPDELFTVQYDPIRIRLYFLGLLPAEQQGQFLDAMEQGLSAQLPALEADRDAYLAQGWLHSSLANDGILAVRRAQLEWIAKARALLDRLGESKG
ncbi:MAG: PadR family transcriptional regulator [Planctomycetes bacterium]|nr:PadR family transcriptional regulator [Planctomycetota bacterium]